jgi:D-3-phosphoglycerate dehydrogenase
MASKVLITDYAWPSVEIEREILAAVGAELVVAPTGETAELVELAADADAILTNWKPVPPQALDAASSCLVVSRYGVGLDNIPVAHATALGILVTNVPDFCVDEVSDHAMALLLACSRRVIGFTSATRAGRWVLGVGREMRRLRGQTVGLVGYGKVAHALVSKARGFGLRILVYTPRIAPGVADEDGIETTDDLGRLLSEADYVSLHAPATPETRGLIGEAELRAMKPSAYLINTSRGALIDEVALERALQQGWIAGAALDVLSEEPPRPDHPLRACENAIITPHVAFYSESAIVELETKAATNVADVLCGHLPSAVVNPEVLTRKTCRFSTIHGTR